MGGIGKYEGIVPGSPDDNIRPVRSYGRAVPVEYVIRISDEKVIPARIGERCKWGFRRRIAGKDVPVGAYSRETLHNPYQEGFPVKVHECLPRQPGGVDARLEDYRNHYRHGSQVRTSDGAEPVKRKRLVRTQARTARKSARALDNPAPDRCRYEKNLDRGR